MNHSIWKYQLDVQFGTAGEHGKCIIKFRMPIGARILHVGTQHDQPTLWVMVDRGGYTEERQFSIYGTGHPMPENPGQYLGTCQQMGGSLIWHVFEVKSRW